MSYDVWLEADLGGPEPIRASHGWNYTSNCAPMWRRAMPDTDGLAGFNGKTAGECVEPLKAGLAAMDADPDSYRAMNPENGWGDFDRQRECLGELLESFEAAPRAVVVVWL